MSQLIKSLMGGFSQEHDLNQKATNTRAYHATQSCCTCCLRMTREVTSRVVECLPVASVTDSSYLRGILTVFVCVQLLLVCESLALRTRRTIAAFFYRKREKGRILFLYNDMLRKRKGFLRHMRQTVRRKARDRKLEVTSLSVSNRKL